MTRHPPRSTLFPYPTLFRSVLERTGFPSDDIGEVRPQAFVPFLGRVAGPACVVEFSLPRLDVGAFTRRLLGHGRETQKNQECGADQSRDCGAGHKCSWRLNARRLMETRSQA